MDVKRKIWLVTERLLWFERYPWLGPALTLGYLLCVFGLEKYGYDITLSPTFLLLVLSIYLGGSTAGLVSLIIAILGGIFFFLPHSPERLLIVVFTQTLTIIITSALHRKAVILDSLDSNIQALIRIHGDLNYIIDDFYAMSRKEIIESLMLTRGRTAELLTRAHGWLELSRRVEYVRKVMNNKEG